MGKVIRRDRRGTDTVRGAECERGGQRRVRRRRHLRRTGRRRPASAAAQTTTTTFDGVPIDVNVALPPEPACGPRRPLPARSCIFHGWGGSKLGLKASMQGWADARLRGLQHERPRLGQLLRRPATPTGSPTRSCADGLQPPDGHPLRGPRRAVPSPAARRRGRRRPAEDRRHRRLLRRRHLDGARRRSRTARCSPTARSSPGRAPSGTPMRSPRRRREIPWTDLAYSLMPERPHARLRRRRSLLGTAAIGVMKQSFVAGLYALGPGDRQLRAAGHRPRRGPDHLVRADQRRRALRRQPAGDDIARRGHDPPLLVLHRPLDRARAAADLERLDRRPLPGRRGDPLLQPHPRPSTRAPTSRSSSSTTATSAARTRPPTPPCAQPAGRLVRPLPEGRRAASPSSGSRR